MTKGKSGTKKSGKGEKVTIMVCAGTGCKSAGSQKLFERLKEKAESLDESTEFGLALERGRGQISSLDVKVSGCHGFCDEGPLVRIDPMGILYTDVKVEDAEQIIEETLLKGKILDDLSYEAKTGEKFYTEEEIPFYKNQRRLVLSNCGKIDPTSLESYQNSGGYRALQSVLAKMESGEVCDEVLESGLRGRGGAGFPTGRKWKSAFRQKSGEKYVIANCDEGDPGAFMDRSLAEGDPHRIIEGATIAGYATRASQGYIYIRAEYPLAVERLQIAIDEAYEKQLLGDDICGSGFDFDFEIKKGAGAFVCGEETALIASIEGQSGRPNPRPPYPVETGLDGNPTTINNVETLANVPLIIQQGADWFKNLGVSSSPGTKTFAITGDIANTGLIEVPMGVTLREIIYEIAGGLDSENEFKAVQIGGPSGGCLPKDRIDIPLDFDSLQKAGAMVGSGGMVVMDEENCMVDVAKFFLDFTQEESCGKCTPCRDGTKRMLEILERLTEGQARSGDIARLEELSSHVKEASLCGLGQTAPNPVISTLNYFKEEYDSHLNDECPAGVCFG